MVRHLAAAGVVPDPEGYGPETRRTWAEMLGKEAGLYERSAATARRWKLIYELGSRRPWVPFEADPYWARSSVPDRRGAVSGMANTPRSVLGEVNAAAHPWLLVAPLRPAGAGVTRRRIG